MDSNDAESPAQDMKRAFDAAGLLTENGELDIRAFEQALLEEKIEIKALKSGI